MGHLTLLEQLQRHAFARGLSAAHLSRLADLASEAEFAEDEVIVKNGVRSDALYLVLEGSVAVELRTPVYMVGVEVLRPGQIFGWPVLLSEPDTILQIRARERTAALRLDGEALASACRSDAELAAELYFRMLHVAAGRIRVTEVRFAEMCGLAL
ncbi:MAG TPA: cyclic nucleotide-binding domain-containing protein [Bryobacteraceae bacterium]